MARVVDSKGTPANPMPLDEVAAKAPGAVALRYDMHRLRQTLGYFSGTASGEPAVTCKPKSEDLTRSS